jgi:ferredoxin
VTNPVHATNATSTMHDQRGGRLQVDPTLCRGHGVCAELLGEHITLDDWGYPIISERPVPAELLRDARRAVTDCPALALRLSLSGPRS